MMTLTPSKENYIKAIFELGTMEGSARVSDIAIKLGVAKSSVAIAVKELEDKGYVERDMYHRALLTEAGREYAAVILDKYGVVMRFLTQVLGVSEEAAADDACRIEHIISQRTACALCAQVRKLERENGCISNECPRDSDR